MVKVTILPRDVGKRRFVYEELEGRPEKVQELKEKVFLPASAYPKRRGRKPKYDFLFISSEDLNEMQTEALKQYLERKFKRPVVVWDIYIVIPGEKVRYVRFVLPWRDRETGKSIRTGKGFFPHLRAEVQEVIRHPERVLGEDKESSQELKDQGEEISEEEKSAPADTTQKKGVIGELNALAEMVANEEDLEAGLEEIEKITEDKDFQMAITKKKIKELEREIAKYEEDIYTIQDMISEYKGVGGIFAKGRIRKLKQQLEGLKRQKRDAEERLIILNEMLKEMQSEN